VKKLISSLFLCFALLEVHGQVNMVPNPSFEERTDCPQGYPDLDGVCSDWMSFRGSPDYMHNCNPLVGTDNQCGHQIPHTGEAYTGFLTYNRNQPDIREHLGIKLQDPLEIGTKYFISFFISPAYSDNIAVNIICNNVGAIFTKYEYYLPEGDGPFLNYAHIYTNSIISDTSNWTKVHGSFIADSTYEYLVFGNFFENQFTDTLELPNSFGPFFSYYYLDDVCVSADSLYCPMSNMSSVNEIQNNNIIIFPNPVNDILQIESEKPIEKVAVYNSFGQLIFTKENFPNADNKLNLEQIDAGIYFVKIRTQSSEVVQKIAVN
jgi:hypothetical protein